MQSRSTLALVTLTAATSGLAGCYSTWDLTPHAVFNLNGYREGHSVAVMSTDKEPVVVTNETALIFKRFDGAEQTHQFKSIEIVGPQLMGINSKGGQVVIDLPQLRLVQAKNFSASSTALLTSGIVIGGGALILGTIFLASQATIIEGRPLRIAGQDEPVRAALSMNGYPDDDARARRALNTNSRTQFRAFAHWANAARNECASIPAFLALARDLENASAPTNLVHSALRAAREEADHTNLCTALANLHGNIPISANVPVTPIATDMNRESLLERLALEAFWDGCVQEGSAAVAAKNSAGLAKDHESSLALRTIAHDEHRHAELSREILAFCLSTGGRSIRHALKQSLERKRAAEESALEKNTPLPNVSDIDEEWLAHVGVPNDSLLHRARVETWEKSVAHVATL